MKKGKVYDIGLSIRYLIIEVECGQMPFTRKDGSKPTKEEALKQLSLMQAQGYACFPLCNNTDARGNCLGHDS